MQLEEQFYELDRAKLKRWLPWLSLFRAFRLAIHPKALVLGCFAVLLLDAGSAALHTLPFVAEWVPDLELSRDRYAGPGDAELSDAGLADLAVTWEKVCARPVGTVADAFSHPQIVLQPFTEHLPPADLLLRSGRGLTGTATAIMGLLLCLIVWSLCGVGIARLTAVRFAADQSVRLRGALVYALHHLGASLGAVLVPMLAVLTLWLGGIVLGACGHLPMVGDVFVGLGWGLLLLAGLGMALILLGLIVGWPLMLASIGVEDADSFDAFSRIYNYVYARPWYALFLALFGLVYGSALITFVATLFVAIHGLAAWSIQTTLSLPATGFAARGIETWHNITLLLVRGYVVSYVWTATTIIYFLLRKCEDAIPLDNVTLPRSSADTLPHSDHDLPLVGIPAAERREQAGSTPTAPPVGPEA